MGTFITFLCDFRGILGVNIFSNFSAMRKDFNIAGPCNSSEHYMLDPLRDMGKELNDLIERKYYFAIHAARQSGKTTLLWELTDKINAEGKYYALYCSLEGVQELVEPEKGIPAIVKSVKAALNDCDMPGGFAENADYSDITNVLRTSLTAYCKILDKPLIILFDEADCLANGILIIFLRQLRNGYVNRPRIPFVHSIALVGMRNIMDCEAQIRPESATLGSESPFNIISESMTLCNFKYEEVTEFYLQHTKLTGQVFEPEAVRFIFEQTQGQPWLVNAIAKECIEKICQGDYTTSITQNMAETAINALILKRPTHFDNLMERLREPRVCKIIEPLILGEFPASGRNSDDYLYTRDLGLIRETSESAEPANQIYAEIIVKTLNYSLQENFKILQPEAILSKYIINGKIDMGFLLKDFQSFWRKNSEIWNSVYKDGLLWNSVYKDGLYEYKEAAPHLVLQAFLQRVINGSGQIIREFALGSKRVDLCIVYKDKKYPVELKIDRGENHIKNGYDQLLKYMDKCGVSEGSIIIFDKNSDKSWGEKIFIKEELQGGKKITVFGC